MQTGFLLRFLLYSIVVPPRFFGGLFLNNLPSNLWTICYDRTVTVSSYTFDVTVTDAAVTGGTATATMTIVINATFVYSVNYNSNGGTGSMTANSGEAGSDVILKACAFTKTSYEFAGWNTIANGNGMTYAAGASYTIGTSDIILYAQWKIPAPSISGIGGSSSGSSSNSRVNIIINGATHNICSSADSKLGDKTVTTVTPDSQKLMEKLAAEANGAVVTIPISGTSENLVASFDGQTLKNMESRNAVIEVKTDGAIFTVPAGEINIDSVSTKLGTSTPLSSITVNLAMVPSSSATELQPTKAAINNGFTTLVQPMNIVNCTYGGKTVSASSYENYVERGIRLPDGIDPNKITTGVIIYADGTVRHVPTKVEIIIGAYYASINSLTNGDFSVAYHPVLFSDVSGNWAQNVINDMGSRMVVNGVGNNLFEPNRSITRAEFAAIVVRALGLLPGTGNNPFSDVKATAWYADYVETAVSYGIITGYDSDTLGPMDTITCEQAMVMVSRAMKITGLSDNLTSETNLIGNCGDSGSTSSYAVAGIEACLQTGVVSGRFGKLIAPKDPICRAGVAQIIKTCSASRTSSEPFNNRTLPQKPEPPLLDKNDVEAQ